MAINRPYRRTYRPMVNGGGGGDYFFHSRYSVSPEHYIRAFLLIQKDLLQIFDFIEPTDTNQKCYSFRIQELLFRACVEVETNCKAILKENGYTGSGDWNINDYRKINQSHRLSSYSIKLPAWNGEGSVRKPFAPWAIGDPLPWYRAYNDTKHDRYYAFPQATFGMMIDAVCGIIVLLSAQFSNEDYTPRPVWFWLQGSIDGFEMAIGDYFRIKFPEDWPLEERYDFDWQKLEKEADPFQEFPFSKP
jgi:hypothetical protein